MRLRNKKTGEIGIVISEEIAAHRFIIRSVQTGECYVHNSIAELNEEWEDYEEPEEYWFISTAGGSCRCCAEDEIYTPGRKEIGNYFETEEEAEKAVEKLKAWKRLKNNGIFPLYYSFNQGGDFTVRFSIGEENLTIKADLDLLFGDEE